MVPFPGPEARQSHCRNPGHLTPGQRIYIVAKNPSIINRPVLSFLCRNHGTQQTETRPAAWDLQLPLLPCGKLDQDANTVLTLEASGSGWLLNPVYKELLKILLTDAYGLFIERSGQEILFSF
ncbi:hypothetical protein CHARACLAT_007592 [Characodon lateralis]|uniref:Uncharacterized protein n=1 Tax=Characodon lateralis TaxID=208331 RepID=A0ABU7CL91_9TELE|nr:hypothetical protein [Characodon lateralis]